MDGMADLIGLYGEMNQAGTTYGTSLEHGFDAMGGAPWELRERYVENSPFFYLDRIETPVLVVHGSEDSAVAPFLGDQIFAAASEARKRVSTRNTKAKATPRSIGPMRTNSTFATG